MGECEQEITAMVSMLARVNQMLTVKTSDLQHDTGVALASCELEFNEYLSPGLMTEGYVEARTAGVGAIWLWKYSLLRISDGWKLERSLEYECNDEWRVVHGFEPTTFSTSPTMVSALPALMEELLALPLPS